MYAGVGCDFMIIRLTLNFMFVYDGLLMPTGIVNEVAVDPGLFTLTTKNV